MRGIKLLFIVLIGLYCGLVGILYFFQEKLLFMSTRLAADYRYSFTYPFTEFNLKTKDGAILNALHFKTMEPKGIVLYFHGNAGDLSRWGSVADVFVEKGYDLMIMDYRTYGKSSGKLSEEALYADGQLFYEHVLEDYPEDTIVLYGRSLGTGIATHIAANNLPQQLILEAPYYSITSVAKDRFPFLPVAWLLNYTFPTYKFIKRLKCPVTIFHGTEDNIVPYASGKALFEAIPSQEKKMYSISGAEHNNVADFPEYHLGLSLLLE